MHFLSSNIFLKRSKTFGNQMEVGEEKRGESGNGYGKTHKRGE